MSMLSHHTPLDHCIFKHRGVDHCGRTLDKTMDDDWITVRRPLFLRVVPCFFHPFFFQCWNNSSTRLLASQVVKLDEQWAATWKGGCLTEGRPNWKLFYFFVNFFVPGALMAPPCSRLVPWLIIVVSTPICASVLSYGDDVISKFLLHFWAPRDFTGLVRMALSPRSGSVDSEVGTVIMRGVAYPFRPYFLFASCLRG